MKKIGLLVLALVVALGALGVGYAAWTDTITIDGTVNTGTVDINAVYFSGTDIYKDTVSDTMVTVFWVKDASGTILWQRGTVPASNVLISSAAATPGVGDDEVDITVTGAFPSEYLVADVIIHCDGTIPVIVTADIDTDDELLEWLWDNGYAYVQAAWVDVPAPGYSWSYQDCGPIVGPIQMHYCDYAKVWLYLDLPQADELVDTPYTQEDFMNQDWSFTGSFDAIQWNESPYLGYTDSNPCNDG